MEELIGPDTVNTIPPATLEAFQDHGRPETRLTEGVDDAKAILLEWQRTGFSITEITDRLLEEGLQLFRDDFDRLLAAVKRHTEEGASSQLNGYSYSLPVPLAAEVKASLHEWGDGNKVWRLWDHDSSLWTDRGESRWLGWLDIIDEQSAHIQLLTSLAEETKRRGFTHAVILGMGGSSLCPEVLQRTFGKQAGFPKLHVLDSTDPAQIHAVERAIHLSSTLFIVSSKSGTTLEPNIFKQYFFARVQALVGAKEAGQRFIAITIRDRHCSKRPRRMGFAISTLACPVSEAAIQRSQISAWCLPRSWASTWLSSSNAQKRWRMPVLPIEPLRRIQAWCWARSSRSSPGAAVIR